MHVDSVHDLAVQSTVCFAAAFDTVSENSMKNNQSKKKYFFLYRHFIRYMNGSAATLVFTYTKVILQSRMGVERLAANSSSGV